MLALSGCQPTQATYSNGVLAPNASTPAVWTDPAPSGAERVALSEATTTSSENANVFAAKADMGEIIPVQQETNVWCWAACAQMVHKYFNPDSDITQAEIVKSILGTQEDAPSEAVVEAASKREMMLALNPELKDYFATIGTAKAVELALQRKITDGDFDTAALLNAQWKYKRNNSDLLVRSLLEDQPAILVLVWPDDEDSTSMDAMTDEARGEAVAAVDAAEAEADEIAEDAGVSDVTDETTEDIAEAARQTLQPSEADAVDAALAHAYVVEGVTFQNLETDPHADAVQRFLWNFGQLQAAAAVQNSDYQKFIDPNNVDQPEKARFFAIKEVHLIDPLDKSRETITGDELQKRIVYFFTKEGSREILLLEADVLNLDLPPEYQKEMEAIIGAQKTETAMN